MSKKSPATTPKRKETAAPKRKAVVRVQHAAAVSGEDVRQRWIAEAAYYRAERRGFSPGRELEDWLEAEKEMNDIDAAVAPAAAASRKARAGAAASRRSS